MKKSNQTNEEIKNEFKRRENKIYSKSAHRYERFGKLLRVLASFKLHLQKFYFFPCDKVFVSKQNPKIQVKKWDVN